ncbi:MAG: hypothetical protein ACE366_02585 [Bradymonadia bacterium]
MLVEHCAATEAHDLEQTIRDLLRRRGRQSRVTVGFSANIDTIIEQCQADRLWHEMIIIDTEVSFEEAMSMRMRLISTGFPTYLQRDAGIEGASIATYDTMRRLGRCVPFLLIACM